MNPQPLPLAVDLDGTLIKTDLLEETANRLLAQRPASLAQMAGWLMSGRTVLKARLAESVELDVASLPFNEPLLAWLREEKRLGRRLVLATASHARLAHQVAAHLGLFDEVLASDAQTNLKAAAKRQALVARYGERGFDYVGNDAADLAVWASAAQAHVVSDNAAFIARVGAGGRLGRVFPARVATPAQALLRSMRLHQWAKNLLIFVPLLAAHVYGDLQRLSLAVLAFLAFGLAASGIYLLNDLVDVDNDRHHARKRLRPFASGELRLLTGWIAWPALVGIALAGSGLWLPWAFTGVLAVYLLTTTAYSFSLKKGAVVDVLTLAILYTMRIIGGATAIDVPLSFWLLLFSTFLFLSLALIKRYSELKAARDSGSEASLQGRGYAPDDLPMISSLGGSAGFIAVLVLALYVQDGQTAGLYASPRMIWALCPLLLFWISRAWLIAHRGRMHDDPIVFALRDRTSWMVVGLMGVFLVLARVL